MADRFVDDLHARTGADDVDAGLEAFFDFLFELAKVTRQLAAIHGALDQHQHFIQVKRFRDVVEGAVLHRADGVAHGVLRGHQDHRGVDAGLLDFLEQLQAIDIGQLDVHQRNVEVAFGQKSPRARAVGRDLNPIPLGLKGFLQDKSERLFVLGNENFSLIHFSRLPLMRL